jgi:hypothetical protein
MDVFGTKPMAEEGKYFRRNVWGWRRLAVCVCTMAPDIAKHCKYWQSNDGDGLNKKQSIALADRLDQLIEDGAVARYIDVEDSTIKALPRQKCFICHGTGIRTDDVGQKQKQPDKIVEADPDDPGNPRVGLKGWCNGCNGWGTRLDDLALYYLELNDVKEFSTFIRASGGFKIC